MPGLDPNMYASIAQAGIGAVEAVAGAFGTAKANRDLKQNSKLRPDYHIQQPIRDNQAMAESRASYGLNDRTINNYNTFTERNLTASLDAVMKGGGAMNNIGDIFGAAQDSERKLATLDDEMQARNVQSLMIQNKDMANELDKEFQFNKYAPWADNQQAIKERLERNQTMVNNGLNTLVGAGTNFLTGNQFKKESDNVYGPKNPEGKVERVQEVSKIIANLDEMLKPGQNIDASNDTSSIQDQLRSQYPGLLGGGWG